MSTIAIIGAGNMGGAIARGLSRGDKFETVKVSDINAANLEKLAAYSPKISVSSSNAGIVKGADVVLLAVKPWLVETVISEIKDCIDYSRTIVVSIAASVTFKQLAEFLDKNGSLPVLFRLIPNTAIEVGQSVSTICSYNASKEQEQEVCGIFDTLGKSFLVIEQQLGAFMALSSCGIAYAFRYIRAAVEGGVEMGIYPEVAKQVVMQTLKGCVELLEANSSHPEVEIDKVTTPGGITIKGLNEMEANGFTNAVIKGLKASLV